ARSFTDRAERQLAEAADFVKHVRNLRCARPIHAQRFALDEPLIRRQGLDLAVQRGAGHLVDDGGPEDAHRRRVRTARFGSDHRKTAAPTAEDSRCPPGETAWTPT